MELKPHWGEYSIWFAFLLIVLHGIETSHALARITGEFLLIVLHGIETGVNH